MKANSRKRVLISSVAMLLVAMVALGTSTFAWFTQSPTANASGLVLKATAAKGLKVLSESQGDGRNTNYTVGDPTTYQTATYLNANAAGTAASTDALYLAPASINLKATTLDAYSTTASSETAATAKTDAEVAPITKAVTGPVYSEKVYLALTGASDETATETVSINNFKVTLNANSKLKEAVRVALAYYDGETTTVLGGFTNTAAKGNIITAVNAEDNTYNNATKEEFSFTAFAGAVDEIGTVDVSGDCYLQVLVYLDGEHADCKTSNIEMSNVVEKVEIGFSIPTE